MLDRMAIVLRQRCWLSFQFSDQGLVDSCFSPWGFERLSRQAESARLSMMRRSQHNEGAVPEIRGELLVGCAVGLPPAFRADMRRSNPHEPLPGRSGSPEILLHPVPQRTTFFRICGSRMSCLAHRTFRKSQLTVQLQIGIGLIFKKARQSESFYQVPSRFADFWASQRADKLGLQVIVCARPIEQQQARYQGRGND